MGYGNFIQHLCKGFMQFKLITSSIILSSSLLLANPSTASDSKTAINPAKAKISAMSSEDFKSYYSKFHKRVPNNKFNSLPRISKDKLNKESQVLGAKNYTELPSVPSDMIIPAEFEENQAIVVSWPYISLDANNQMAYQDFVGLYVDYNQFTQTVNLIPVTNYPDVNEESVMSSLYLDLVTAIQTEAQVWITVNDLKDTTEILEFAQANEKPFTNYKFIEAPINSIWYRDSGPVAFYYDNLNKIGYIDFEYCGRPLDDVMPEIIAANAGHSIIKSTIEYEGGNVLVNGKGTLFTSTAVEVSNKDTDGQMMLTEDKQSIYFIEKTPLTLKNCEDSLRKVMNLSDIQIMPSLVNDGGTGHIDLYADFFDENKFVFSQFPENLSTHRDYKITRNNVDSMLTLISCNNAKYTNSFIPLPRKNNGAWYSSENDYARYTRTFSNHLVVNKTIIQPVFHNATSGDKTGDLAAIEEIKKAYPGYKIVPIDMRALDGLGGSIHCITKQIPAENPIRIFHRPPSASELISDVAIPYFNIQAKVESNKEISTMSLFYRTKGTAEWSSMPMIIESEYYTAHLPTSETSGNINALEYYLSATSTEANKTITKPMTAPEGFYTIESSTASIDQTAADNTLQVYPNPAVAQVFAKFNVDNLGTYTLRISNAIGNTVYTNSINISTVGEQMISLNSELLEQGTYWLTVISADGKQQSQGFVVVK